MSVMKFSDAIQDAIAQSMGEDPRIILIGEDIHATRMKLFIQFGEERLLTTPISEIGFLGAAVTAYILGILLNKQQDNAANWRVEIRRRISDLES